MKKLLFIAFAIISSGSILFLDSCKAEEEDPCENIFCLNNGVCTDGICTGCDEYFYGDLCQFECVQGTFEEGTCKCKTGYEGNVCDTAMRTKFLGTWKVNETCPGDEFDYSVAIDLSDEGILYFSIDNFRNDVEFPMAIAVIDRNDSKAFEIENQPFGQQQTIEGLGNMNTTNDTITIEYTFQASFGTEKCKMKLYK